MFASDACNTKHILNISKRDGRFYEVRDSALGKYDTE